MTILDAGLIPPQLASDPIGFFGCPSYEEVKNFLFNYFDGKIFRLGHKNQFLQSRIFDTSKDSLDPTL